MAIPDFAPGDVVKNIELPATSHTFKIVARRRTTRARRRGILVVTTPLEAGKNYTAVANLDASGDPQLSLFTNNVNPHGRR